MRIAKLWDQCLKSKERNDADNTEDAVEKLRLEQIELDKVCVTLKRVVFYLSGLFGTLKKVAWYFEMGGVVL